MAGRCDGARPSGETRPETEQMFVCGGRGREITESRHNLLDTPDCLAEKTQRLTGVTPEPPRPRTTEKLKFNKRNKHLNQEETE